MAYYALQVVQSFVRSSARSSDGLRESSSRVGAAEFDVRLEWCARALQLAEREERDLRVLNAPSCPEFDAQRLLAVAFDKERRGHTLAAELANALAAAFAPSSQKSVTLQSLKVPHPSPQRLHTLDSRKAQTTTSVHFLEETCESTEAAEAAASKPQSSNPRGSE